MESSNSLGDGKSGGDWRAAMRSVTGYDPSRCVVRRGTTRGWPDLQHYTAGLPAATAWL